jgi:hypothetical protein
MDKRKKRASVFIQLERLDSANIEMTNAKIGTSRFDRALSKYGNAYSRLVRLGLAGQRAIEKSRRHGKR